MLHVNVYQYRFKVDRIIDGDTIVAWIDLGFDIGIKEILRFYWVNTPEIRGSLFSPEGAWATLYTDLWLRGQEDLWTKDRSVDIKTYISQLDRKDYLTTLYMDSLKYNATGKYGRALAVIYREGDTRSLNEALLDQGYPDY
jgi:micrococcal nuclease